MRSRFDRLTRGAVLQSLRAGLTLTEAAEAADLPVQTLKNWLSRGRGETGTEHAAFAAAVDDARAAAAHAPMSDREFCGHLAKAIRGGSVQAMRLWVKLRAEDERVDMLADPFAELDSNDGLSKRLSKQRSRLDRLDDLSLTNKEEEDEDAD